ncbi:MAG TPA: hypothetical protein VFI54_24440 [Solirubrobacteraceae bacterium]|nr:hypothetical protein [Solirubrobacteraceae bacterium]
MVDLEDTYRRIARPWTHEQHADVVVHCCRRALDLDGRTHDHASEDLLPVAYDVAAPLIESARLD